MALIIDEEELIANGIEDLDDDGLEDSGINPVLELNGRLEHSRITGDYYRDLSANYEEYSRTDLWPEHPFPNEKYTYQTIDGL